MGDKKGEYTMSPGPCAMFSFAFGSYKCGRFKNAASSQEQRPKYVHACVHIDFPTRLFTAEAKRWLERKGEQAKTTEPDRENSTSGPVVRLPENTNTQKKRGTNTHMQTVIFLFGSILILQS